MADVAVFASINRHTFHFSVTFLVAMHPIFLLILARRYERKKNISLAIKAFALLPRDNSVLVVAGGYDAKVSENSGRV